MVREQSASEYLSVSRGGVPPLCVMRVALGSLPLMVFVLYYCVCLAAGLPWVAGQVCRGGRSPALIWYHCVSLSWRFRP